MAVRLRAGEAIRRIVERSDIDEFTERVVDSFWDRPEYRPYRPLREDLRSWVRWNIDLVIRWLVDGQPPTNEDLARFRERAQALASDGMPADLVPANFRRGARYAWTAILESAHDDERPALLETLRDVARFQPAADPRSVLEPHEPPVLASAAGREVHQKEVPA